MNLVPVILLCLVTVAYGGNFFFNTTIGPYGVCGADHLNVERVLSECYSKCIRLLQPDGGYTLTVHQSDVRNAGPLVVECRKVTLEQIFTKIWLFSTSRTEPRTSYKPVSEGECRDVVKRIVFLMTAILENLMNWKRNTIMPLIQRPGKHL